MYRVIYIEKIRKRGWFGISYTVPKLRTAHVDARCRRQLQGHRFSLRAMMMSGLSLTERG